MINDSKKVIAAIGKVKDFTELSPNDIAAFTDAIVAINEFNKKLSHYGEKIFQKHMKSLGDWKEYLTPKDWEAFYGNRELIHTYDRYVRCFVSGNMTKYDQNNGWSMGASTAVEESYKFSKDGKTLTVTNSWKTQSARFNHIPWIPRERRFIINLDSGKVDVEGDNINKQS